VEFRLTSLFLNRNFSGQGLRFGLVLGGEERVLDKAPRVGVRWHMLKWSDGGPGCLSVSISLAGFKTVGNFAKGIGFPQLAEEHRDELTPTGESPGVAFGVGLFDEFLEFISWKKL
jgi:hypothetical protein